VAQLKERQETFTLAPLRDSSGGKPPDPPIDPPGRRGGSDGDEFWFLILVVILIGLMWLTGIATPWVNKYSVAVASAIANGVVYSTVVVLFWIFIPTALLLLFAFRVKYGTFLFVTDVRAALARKSARSMMIGGLIICACFHIAIYLQNFEAVIATQIVACGAIVAHVIERLRFSLYPQDDFDLETLLAEIEANRGKS
jgi:hypothetical protein